MKLVARKVSTLIPNSSEDIVDLVTPLYLSLIESPRTSVQACWHLLDKVSLLLGPERTKDTFLEPVTSHYKSLYTNKHIKLYHRSFMLVLMTRLRMSVFLENFCNILIEAAGGNREYMESPANTPSDPFKLDSSFEGDSTITEEGGEPTSGDAEIFSFDTDSWDMFGFNSKTNMDSGTLANVAQSLKHTRLDSIDVYAPVVFAHKDEDSSSLGSQGPKENCVVQMSKETLLWLSHRLGPVLTARHVSRNLLRMMSLCFLPPEGLEPTEQSFRDQQIRLSPCMMAGDNSFKYIFYASRL